MCVGGGRVRAAGEIGQGSPFSYLPCILHRGEETSLGRDDPTPQQSKDSSGRSGRVCSTPEIPAVVMWGQALWYQCW